MTPTPGSHVRRDPPVTGSLVRRVGIVLEVFDRPTGNVPSWYDGPTCSVLLIDRMHAISGVIVPPRHSGPRNVDMVLPDRTSAGMLAAYERAKRGEIPMPSVSVGNHPEGTWGSKVIVGYLNGRIPVIDGYLTHPATTTARMPVVKTNVQSVADVIVAAGQEWKPFGSTPLPESISPAAVPPPPSIPIDYQKTGALRNAYVQGWTTGWLNGAEKGYDEIVDGTPVTGIGVWEAGEAPGEVLALQAGIDAGYNAGISYGRAIGRGEPPPDQPPAETIDYTTPTTDGSVADTSDDDGNEAAVATGADRMLEYQGVRVIVRESGETIIDARDAGANVTVQAAAGSRVLVRCGAIPFVVDSEAVRAGTLTGGDALTREPARKAAQDTLITEINAAITAAVTPLGGTNINPVTSSPDCGTTKITGV